MVTEKLIPLSQRSEWNEALTGIPHAFSHTWESCHAMYLTHNKDTFLYTYRNNDIRIILPICERSFKGNKDIFTPFGVPGFAGTAPCPEFSDHWRNFARLNQYICGYIGLNPILDENSYHNPGDTYEYNEVFVIDLKKPITQLYQQFSESRKRQIRKDEDNHKKVTLDKNVLTDFLINNFHRFMKNRNAKPLYNFSMDTLTTITNTDNVLLLGIIEKGEVVIVTVFPFTPYIGDYLFNISLPEGRLYSTLLIWYGLNLLKSHGVQYLNLGGGRYKNDPTSAFKKRFNPEVYPLRCLKQIYNQDVYSKLCGQKGKDPTDFTGYFPAYYDG